MMSKGKATIATGVVLVACLCIGAWLSLRKPLWNDEIYTQIYSVERLSSLDIILSRIREANTCPLFYLVQKGICGLTQYKFPQEWDGEWNIGDQRAQILLRISSNVFMSFSIALVFYFFIRHYSLGAGLYSLLVSLSSYVVWIFWAEARPYSLWFLLTTLQLLLFLYIIQREKFDPRCRVWLIGTHMFLAATIVFGIAQVIIVSFLLWLFKERECKKYIWLTIIPVCLCLYYYFYSPKYSFWFGNRVPREMIIANLPGEQIFVFMIYACFVFWGWSQRNIEMKKNAVPFLFLTILMVISACAVLAILKAGDTHGEGFQISERYFVYLAPVGIIATTVFSAELFRAFRKQKWLAVNIVIILGGLLIIRILRTYIDVIGLGIY